MKLKPEDLCKSQCHPDCGKSGPYPAGEGEGGTA